MLEVDEKWDWCTLCAIKRDKNEQRNSRIHVPERRRAGEGKTSVTTYRVYYGYQGIILLFLAKNIAEIKETSGMRGELSSNVTIKVPYARQLTAGGEVV